MVKIPWLGLRITPVWKPLIRYLYVRGGKVWIYIVTLFLSLFFSHFFRHHKQKLNMTQRRVRKAVMMRSMHSQQAGTSRNILIQIRIGKSYFFICNFTVYCDCEIVSKGRDKSSLSKISHKAFLYVQKNFCNFLLWHMLF